MQLVTTVSVAAALVGLGRVPMPRARAGPLRLHELPTQTLCVGRSHETLCVGNVLSLRFGVPAPLEVEKKPSATDRVQTLPLLTPLAITRIGVVVNLLLAALKLGVGTLAASTCLIADGWHSLSDLASDLLCWVAVKSDALEHYCTLGIATMLTTTGVAMALGSAIEVLRRIRAPALVAVLPSTGSAELAALGVAIVSVLSKELLFGVTHRIGIRCRSPSIIANAHHHRSDAYSSVVAIIGIVGVFCGSGWLDPLATVVVGAMIAWMGVEAGQESFEALLPRGAQLLRRKGGKYEQLAQGERLPKAYER